jgi:hypothetical protein
MFIAFLLVGYWLGSEQCRRSLTKYPFSIAEPAHWIKELRTYPFLQALRPEAWTMENYRRKTVESGFAVNC